MNSHAPDPRGAQSARWRPARRHGPAGGSRQTTGAAEAHAWQFRPRAELLRTGVLVDEQPSAVAEVMKSTVPMLAVGSHFADNLLTWGRNLSMLEDGPFVTAWEPNIESASDQAIVWRRYVLACAAYHCVQLDGDFVECGAYTGVGIKTIVDYLGGTDFPKTFWGYDVFEHNESMLNHAMPEHGAGLYEQVCAKFTDYPQVRLVKGLIPEVFAYAPPQRVAYLHIDLNQAPAEIAALDHCSIDSCPGAF